MFICCNEKLRDIRQSLWRRLVGDLGKSTEPGFSHVFQSGLATAMGEDPPTEATKMEWPVQLQAAYEAQTTIGWDQVLAGRLYKKWDLLSEYNRVNAGEQLRTGWTGRAVRLCWEFGLELWTIRNGMIYGTGGNTSSGEQSSLKELALALYEQRYQVEGWQSLRSLACSENEIEQMPPDTIKAWIEQVRYLSPDTFTTVVANLKKHKQRAE